MKKKKDMAAAIDEEELEELTAEPSGPELTDNRAVKFFAALLTTMALCALPMLIMWAGNVANLNRGEALLPILLSVGFGVIVFAIALLTARNSVKAGFLSAIICEALLNFSMFTGMAGKLLPFLPEKAGGILLALLLCGAAVYLALRLCRTEGAPKILLILCLTLLLLVGFNTSQIVRLTGTRVKAVKVKTDAAATVPPVVEILADSEAGAAEIAEEPEDVADAAEIAEEREDVSETAKSAEEPEDVAETAKSAEKTENVFAAAASRPQYTNLYFFVLDECGDFYTMEKYYGLKTEDNEFYRYLTDKGFNVSLNSSARTNRSVYSAANMLAMDYVCTEKTTNTQARQKQFDGQWFKDLSSLGFGSYQVSSHIAHYAQLKELTRESTAEKLISSITEGGESNFDLMIDKSVFSLWRTDRTNWLDDLTGRILNMRLQRVSDYYADPKNYEHETRMALHTYLLTPHTPFFMDAEGNYTPTSHRCDWVDRRYYLGQYIYTARYLEEIIDNIIRYDPNAVIMVQSDHSMRGGVFTEESMEVSLTDQCRVLNAVYLAGEELDIEGLSVVNTMRAVMSWLGIEYEAVEDAEYIFWQEQLNG